jgi:hypothetical protein
LTADQQRPPAGGGGSGNRWSSSRSL